MEFITLLNKQHFMAPNHVAWYSSGGLPNNIIEATNILIINKHILNNQNTKKSNATATATAIAQIVLHSNVLLVILGQMPILSDDIDQYRLLCVHCVCTVHRALCVICFVFMKRVDIHKPNEIAQLILF